MKSNKEKLTEYSISSYKNKSEANLFSEEEENNSAMRKNTDSSSIVPKEHDPDLKAGDPHNVKKEHKQITLNLHSNLIAPRSNSYSKQRTNKNKNNHRIIIQKITVTNNNKKISLHKNKYKLVRSTIKDILFNSK